MTLNKIDRKQVISLLTQDDFYRKQKEWPLISLYENGNDLNNKNQVISYDLFMINCYHSDENFPFVFNTKEKIINHLNLIHPFTTILLEKFHNNLVACGGAVCKSIINLPRHQVISDDIDFFFYGLDVHTANEMRIEIIEYLINIWKSFVGKIVNRSENSSYYVEGKETILQNVKFYIQRNKYVTTLHVEELCDIYDHPKVYMYQFIHRIYPNISSIIGGFDLSASSVAYNGKAIYTTPLGFWTLENNSIIIDTGRRSTSFEYRLKKYSRYGFRLIFPGLNQEIIETNLIDVYSGKSFEIFQSKIEKLANDNEYYLHRDADLRDFFSKKSGESIIDKYDELAFNKLQKEKNILPLIVLNINCQRVYIKDSNGNEYDWWRPDTNNDQGNCGNRKYYVKKLSDYGDDKNYLSYHSDYHYNHMYYKHIPSANITRLRLNNLEAVLSMVYLDDHKNIKEKLIQDVSNPNLGINDFVIESYKSKAKELFFDFKKDYLNNHHSKQTKLIKFFGSFTSEIITKNKPDRIIESIVEIIESNNELCKKELTGIKWITENPGRQWTSSINPIFKDPRDWYGKHYIPVLVGIPPEIETTMRLMKLERTNSFLSKLPNDIFNMLLFYILRSYANEAWKYI